MFDSTTGSLLRQIGLGQRISPCGLALSLTVGNYLSDVCGLMNNRLQVFNATTRHHVDFLGVALFGSPYGLKIYPGSGGKSLFFVFSDDKKESRRIGNKIIIYDK